MTAKEQILWKAVNQSQSTYISSIAMKQYATHASVFQNKTN